MKRPGQRLRALAARVCRPKTMERLVDPIVADLQCEYDETTGRGHVWRSRLVLARGYMAFWKAIMWFGLRSACGGGAGEDESRIRRAWVFSILAFIAVTVLFVLPPLLSVPRYNGPPLSRVLVWVYLIPQALPLSIPAGVCIGVLCAMRGRPVTARNVFAIFLLGTAATVVAGLIIEWMVPWANQAWRELMIVQFIPPGRPYHLEPGLNEMGFSGLRHRTDPAAVRHFHLMVSLSAATVPLGLFALGLASSVKRVWAALVVAVVATIAYPMTMVAIDSLSPREWRSPIVEAWAPNVLFLAAAWVMLYRARLVPLEPGGVHSGGFRL
jgi:hypothetical protein